MKENLIKAAMGEIDADLILKGAEVYDVFTGETRRADVAVKDGIICGVGEYSGANEVDVSGKYILPGFIDAHMHIESSMVTPAEYAKAALAHGVTTVIADPHEIANVCGRAGLKFMKENAALAPLDIKFMLPSCVPCAPFDHSGAEFDAADTKELAPDFFGIAEMMNYPGVISCDSEVLGKLVDGKIIDGHAPMLTGRELDAYVCAGIKTEHECTTPEELREKLGKGMYVMLREGTLSKNLDALLAGVTSRNSRFCLFCTDDRFIGEVLKDGSIDLCVQKAVEGGTDIRDAINMATVNAAVCYGLKAGAVAPSYRADLVVCDDIVPKNIRMVYKDGKLVARDGKAVFDIKPAQICAEVMNTVHLDPVTAEFFAHEPSAEFTAIELIPDTIVTKKVRAKRGDKLSKVCVIERHKRTGNKGFAYVTNYGITNGAVASSIGHDSHNVIVIGDNDRDMAAAVNALGADGGIAVCSRGAVKARLTLEIAGLMSAKTAEDVTAAHEELYKTAADVGVNKGIEPFLSLAFLPLPVIPEIRVTDSGLFDVEKFEFI
ncbi:MAG: adenine deaminase [Firmicutes bacterium]|nr:adenine deaminase [Bacillota bacterium]